LAVLQFGNVHGAAQANLRAKAKALHLGGDKLADEISNRAALVFSKAAKLVGALARNTDKFGAQRKLLIFI
jgi:hypothetical protein